MFHSVFDELHSYVKVLYQSIVHKWTTSYIPSENYLFSFVVTVIFNDLPR